MEEGEEDNQGCSEVFVAPAELDWEDRQKDDVTEYVDEEMAVENDVSGLAVVYCGENLLKKHSLEVVGRHERSKHCICGRRLKQRRLRD